MLLEAVWLAIPELEWETPEALGKACGINEETLKQAVEFLIRWDFVEVRKYPYLQVRRRAGTISPVELGNLLRCSVSETETATLSGRVRVATRVACRTCGCRSLAFSGPFEVECANCHDRQWYAIDKSQKLKERKLFKRRGILERVSLCFRL